MNNFHLSLISLACFPETEVNFFSEVLEIFQGEWMHCGWKLGFDCAFAGSHFLATCKFLFAAYFCSGRFVASLTMLYRVPCALFILSVKAITLICVYLNNTHCHVERDLETSRGFV